MLRKTKAKIGKRYFSKTLQLPVLVANTLVFLVDISFKYEKVDPLFYECESGPVYNEIVYTTCNWGKEKCHGICNFDDWRKISKILYLA